MRSSAWFRARGSWGRWAFILHRVTGLALSVYLGMHLILLNQLRAGPSAWDAFVRFVSAPGFLALDALLLGAAAFHGFNGLRLTLLGIGWGVRWQKEMLWASVALAVGLTAWFGARMMSG